MGISGETIKINLTKYLLLSTKLYIGYRGEKTYQRITKHLKNYL